MQYHAISLARKGCFVSLVGYAGTAPLDEVMESPRIHIQHIDSWAPPAYLPFVIRAVLHVITGCFKLLVVLLWRTPPANLLLLQTPPAIPVLLIALVACLFRRSGWRRPALVVDYHNFGYSLLSLKLGEKHPFVRLHYMYERFLGRFADANFCVTDAMQKFLVGWTIGAVPLHDRPASLFRPTPLLAQHALFERLREAGDLRGLDAWWPTEGTLFTVTKAGVASPAPQRPKLVVSSTSWTPDEDLGQVLDALPALDALLQAADQSLVVAVTGRGDMRAAFETRVGELSQNLKSILVITLWLSFTDYAHLLGSADIGLSLHTSSSGLDLPMKVLDMFGSGLPVCARNFRALPELVRHRENGYVFESTEQLTSCLALALGVSSETTNEMPRLRKAVAEFRLDGWDSTWDRVAWPCLSRWLSPSV